MNGLLTYFLILLLGSVGTLGIVVALIILHPEKIQIWASWLYKGARLLTRKAEYGYIALDVAGHINTHIAKDILPQLTGLVATAVTIRWHNSADTIVHEAEGTVFVRMHPHEERYANILHATLAATPRLIAPALRSQINANDSKAIDLHFCRRLAERLSHSALVVYRLNVLDPIIRTEPRLQAILEDFQSIELRGLFVPVFIQELVKLGIAYPVDHLPGLDAEVRQFYNYLKDIAEKPRGTDVNLAFHGRYIRIHVLLVAKPETRAVGIDPYRMRMGRELARGAETVYVIASGINVPFAEEVVDAFDSDLRLLTRPQLRHSIMRDGIKVPAIIAPFERNEGYRSSEPTHTDPSQEDIIPRGTRKTVTVIDVKPSYATADFDGIQVVIRAEDLAWEHVSDCTAMTQIGQQFEIEVTGSDPTCLDIYASRKACLPNPLDSLHEEQLVGKHVNMLVKGRGGRSPNRFLFGVSADPTLIPIRLHETEVLWGSCPDPLTMIAVGEIVPTIVIDMNRQTTFIACSKKRLVADRWDQIRAKYLPGTRLIVSVSRVDSSGAVCEIEPGLVGFVPASEFQQAGLEYSHFATDLRVGQKLYVYVGRVVAGMRQRISLRLQRNVSR